MQQFVLAFGRPWQFTNRRAAQMFVRSCSVLLQSCSDLDPILIRSCSILFRSCSMLLRSCSILFRYCSFSLRSCLILLRSCSDFALILRAVALILLDAISISLRSFELAPILLDLCSAPSFKILPSYNILHQLTPSYTFLPLFSQLDAI